MSSGKPKLTRRASKIRPVPINLMLTAPELITQRPFIPAHGNTLAKDLDLNMLGYPVINHRDGKFWICDGQHRVFALRENGFGKDNLDCEVYENLTDEEMAQTFLGRDRRRAISPYVKFHISCTAGDPMTNAIRRVVEANGLKISRRVGDNTLSAVTSLIRIYEAKPSKDTAVGWCVRVAKNAFHGDARAFDGTLLEALGMIHNHYNGKAVEVVMQHRLSAIPGGVRALMRRAEQWREKTGNLKVYCVAATLVEAYNKGAAMKDHLRPWWKDHAAA